MARITYVADNGARRSVEVDVGLSVMRGAQGAGISGLDAVCGGQCACATCHCLIDADWFDRLPPPEELEDEMLDDVASGRTPVSRLSCQIEVTPELDGLIVHIPPSQ